MRRKLKESVSIFIAKNPARAILCGIFLLNIVLLAISALLISALSPDTLKNAGFFESIFYTISMILDAGCIQYVVADIGEVSVSLIIVCLVTIFIGMITFTGAIIGYVTNYISSFIDSANSGDRPLKASGHTVILNWNSRASEILNDLLYSGKKELIVILVPCDYEQVKREINERISVTLRVENKKVFNQTLDMRLWERVSYIRKNRLKNRLTVIVREGDTYSTKQLNDISILSAKTVIILGRDIQNTACKYELLERLSHNEQGNSNTVKTLVQVAEITSSEASADDQVVVVEIDDDWTASIVNRIISHKEKLGKCNIVPVPVNRILGQLLSQFSIMPELNFVYGELFSNKGAEFFCKPANEAYTDESDFISYNLCKNDMAIPLTTMRTKIGEEEFFVAATESDCTHEMPHLSMSDYTVSVNYNYWLEQRNIVIIGHNSNCKEIMDGFYSFRNEWNKSDLDILNVIVIDDKKSLEKRNYYRDYPYVRKVVEADVFDGDIIKKEIADFVSQNEQDTSVLILSDDSAGSEDIDANALTFLIYVQDVIQEYIKKDPDFDRESIDVIVEIVNPKNYDVVRSYSVNNVIISNRYISKMITQISRKESLYEFYRDILTYDDADVTEYNSKELYIKKVNRFFEETPAPCSAAELIRAVYEMTPEENKAIVIGYIRPGGQMTLFSGCQYEMQVELRDTDKLIVFSNH